MSEYLSKEEIKQWRSSLEKITLEEFAARLGKKIEERKTTNDLVDIVLHGKPVVSNDNDWNNSGVERLSSIANKAYEKEKDIRFSPFSVKNLQSNNNVEAAKPEKKAKPQPKTKPMAESVKKDIISELKTGDQLRDEVRIVFKKSLTDREQKVFDYLSEHMNEVVYAKDLATLLDLPRDYIYKYIKNLRAKIEGEALKNADKGGFILAIK